MGHLIDTSVFVTLERRGLPPKAIRSVAEFHTLAVAAISASELLAGVYFANSPRRRAQRLAFAEEVLSLVPVLPLDLKVARVHAEI